MLTQAITPRFGSGFGPAGLRLCGSATLSGSRLRLTDGGPNQTGAAFATERVDVTRAFTTTFEFQFTANGADPMGQGLAIVIQADQPYSWSPMTDWFGIPSHPHLVVKFGTFNDNWPTWGGMCHSDNATKLYVGTDVPSINDGPANLVTGDEIDVPKTSVDFHSGHVIRCTLAYDPVAHTLAETLTDLTTLGTWTHTYSAVNIQPVFARVDVVGQYAFAGFSGSTGAAANDGTNGTGYGRGQSTQEILNWSWDDGTTPAPLPYTGALTLTAPGGSAGAVFAASGKLVRTLWQASPLPAGVYPVAWDGLDNRGLTPADPGPYTVRAALAAETYTNYSIGNDALTPADMGSGYSPLGLNGVAVKPDGTAIYLAVDSEDTVGQLGFKVADNGGRIDGPASRAYGFGTTMIGEAVACDARYVYLVYHDAADHSRGLVRFDTTLPGPSHGGFIGPGPNADGSTVGTITGGFAGLTILPAGTYADRRPLPAVAVSNPADPTTGVLWVADVQNNLVRRYDKVTGSQVGTPIAVTHPTGIAVDPSGNAWVSHGLPATLVSVYSAAGVFARDATELLGLVDVRGLAIGGGNLWVADNGAGKVLNYSVSGTGVTNGNAPAVNGGPAAVGNDDGHTKFWDLKALAFPGAGPLFTAQTLPGNASTQLGCQLAEWSGDQTTGWVRGGYEYQSCLGGYRAADPFAAYSSTLKRYAIDLAGVWSYAGFAGHPGYATNTWSKLVLFAPIAPPKFVHLGTKDFFVLSFKEQSPNNCRALFFSLDVGGYLHAAAIVGTVSPVTGHNYTWHDAAGDGIPLDSQVIDGGAAGPDNLHCDDAGNLWYTLGDAPSVLWKIPLGGFDGNNNPLYSWPSAAVVATLPTAPKAFVVAADGVYVLANDPGIGPQTSLSAFANYSWGAGNALAKYSLAGVLQWTIPLAQYSQMLDVIPMLGPAGGVVVGSAFSADLAYVTQDGQLTSIRRATAFDNLDFPGGSLRVCRNGYDDKLDVFAEALGSAAGAWYRVDDRDARTAVSAALTLDAGPPPPSGTTQFDTRGGYQFPTGVFANAAFD